MFKVKVTKIKVDSFHQSVKFESITINGISEMDL